VITTSPELSWDACDVCGSQAWSTVFQDHIREGRFGNYTRDPATIARCGNCGIERLDDATAKSREYFESDEYREDLGYIDGVSDKALNRDPEQLVRLAKLWPHSVRGETVVDVGCGTGSFLDHVAGLASVTIAVEPRQAFHATLGERFERVFSYAADALPEYTNKVDTAFCFYVLDQTLSPRKTLTDIWKLLRPGGRLLVSVANREAVLGQMIPETFLPFLYRAQHRWYYNKDSIRRLALSGGFEVEWARCVQDYGISNAFRWVRDGVPSGDTPLPALENPLLDKVWRVYLEENFLGDSLFALLRRRA
jgi:SAM-dependent methyltransferase